MSRMKPLQNGDEILEKKNIFKCLTGNKKERMAQHSIAATKAVRAVPV